MVYQYVNIGDTSKAVLADQVATGSAYVQALKLLDPTEDSETPLVLVRGSQATLPMSLIDAAGNALSFANPIEVTASPTIGTGANGQYDSLHTTIITFSNCARANGGTGRILGARLICKHDTFAGTIHGIVFRKTFTGTTAQATLAVSDTDKLEALGDGLKFDFSTAPPLGGGRVVNASRHNLPMDFKCDSGTDDLFMVLQLTSADTPTFAAADLVPFLSIAQD